MLSEAARGVVGTLGDAGGTASQGVDEDCSDVLSGYQSSGVCAGGGGASGCSGLSACCPDLPVMENPSECYTVASNGTDEACNESLQTYRESGYCGSSDSCVLVFQECGHGIGHPQS